MKKYWIKDLDETQVIHAPTEEIARKLCNKFHELGLKRNTGASYSENSYWDVYKKETCYSPSNGHFGKIYHYLGYKILTIDQLLDFQEYPKVMEVSFDGNVWLKRVVFMEKNGKFLAWCNAKTIEEAESITDISTWNYAREIDPNKEIKNKINELEAQIAELKEKLKKNKD